jgi:deaminated glutathione amidase
MTSRTVTISVVQMLAVDGEKKSAIDRMMAHLDEAGARGSQLTVLPEAWTGTAFSDPKLHRDIAEDIPGPVTDLLCEKARRYSMAICGSLYERKGNAVHNTAPMISQDGEIVGRYRKTHLFDVPNRTDIRGGIKESEKITAGDELPVFDLKFAKVGVSICVDLRFPEVYRELALKGSEITLCVSAFLAPRVDHWEFLLRARANENQTFVVASGQVGIEPKSGIGFVGRSMIVDPWGTIVATAPDTETVMTSAINLDYIAEVRRRWPLLQQRRPSLYRTIAKA